MLLLLRALITSVPSGPYVLGQTCGRDTGLVTPGANWCWWRWQQVAYVVSKQTVTYNAAAKDAPTKDSVFVNIDLSINLKIGPDAKRVKDFVYKMGAERLDAYLNFQVNESIRTLVYEVTHDRVNDLRSEFASNMMRDLQGKMGMFGVEVVNVKVTDVQLPRELQERLEKTTAFQTRLKEEAKNHEYTLLQLTNVSEQGLADSAQTFTLQKHKLDAQRGQYEVTMDGDERGAVRAQGRDREGARRVRGRGDQGEGRDRGRAVQRARGEGEARVNDENRVRAPAARAQQAAKTRLKEAEATKNSSQDLARAREEQAAAEGDAATKREEKRRFEQRLKLAEIDAQLASKGRKVLSGDAGKALLGSFVAVRGALDAPGGMSMGR